MSDALSPLGSLGEGAVELARLRERTLDNGSSKYSAAVVERLSPSVTAIIRRASSLPEGAEAAGSTTLFSYDASLNSTSVRSKYFSTAARVVT